MPDRHVEAHQALYGYAEGHRLLASSTRLNDHAQRLLRSLTDVAFDGRSTSYLTICPLPTQRAHAFIKTWPADHWTRPGSVWSHVLLVDLPDLGTLLGMRGIVDAFWRPHPRSQTLSDTDLARYREPTAVPATEFIHLRKKSTNAALLHQVYSGLYGGTHEHKARIQVDVASDHEDLLLAVFEQQWPRLRRSFSCRTRQRPTTVHVDLEILEQLPAREAQHRDPASDWDAPAAADLGNVNWQYRQFLQTCGAESHSGREDFRPLTQLYDAITSPDRSTGNALTLIRTHYPAPEDQRGLKRALFGAADSNPPRPLALTSGSQWPTAEDDRVRLAVRCANYLDLGSIDLGARLAELYRADPLRPSPLQELDLELLQPRNVEALVRGITARAEPAVAVAVAVAQPDLGVLIAAQNRALLAYPDLWAHLDNDLLVDLLNDPDALRSQVLDRLLEEGAAEPITTICGVNPDAWWELLLSPAQRRDSMIYQRAQTLRAVLLGLGTAALNSPPFRPHTRDQLMTLLLAADLSTGLWRRAASGDWTAAVKTVAKKANTAPRAARERLAAVALVSAMQSGSATDRTDGWRTCFPFLHEALRSDTFDREAWALLAATLPSGVAWDRCNRLRRGLAQEIRKDRWAVDAVRAAVAAAGPDAGALVELIEEKAAKEKKDHWLKQLVKMLTR